MRILIDARKAFDTGIGTYIRGVLPRVVRRLPGLEFAVLVEPGGASRHSYLEGVPVDLVETAAPPFGPLEQAVLRRVVRQADFFWATCLAHPVYCSTPMIATVHDVIQLATPLPDVRRGLVKAAARLYFDSLRRRARLLLFNSSFTRQEFERHVGHPRGDTWVTPLGVESAWFDMASPRSPSSRPSLVWVGNLRPHKNLPRLLQAFAAVKDTVPHDLLLVGVADGLPSADAATRALVTGLGDRIRISEVLSDATLRAAVAAADALIMPSLYEGFGLPALEAMAARVPVIAAQAASLPEVCGNSARYFDPTSVDSIALQLAEHAVMPHAERRQRVADGLARARAFTWDETARLTVQAIGSLAAAGGMR